MHNLLCALLTLSSAQEAELPSVEARPLELVGELQQSAVHGSRLLVATDEALQLVSLASGEVTTLVADRDGLCMGLALDDERAAVVTVSAEGATSLEVLDLAEGRRLQHFAEDLRGLRDVGFLGEQRLFLVFGDRIQVLDLVDGKVLQTVEVGGGILMDAQLSGERLYAAREYAGGLAVIDPERGELLELIETEAWLFDLQVHGRQAYSISGNVVVDLVEKTTRPLPRPEGANLGRLFLRLGPGGDAFATDGGRIWRYGADGELRSVVRFGPDDYGQLLAVDGSRAVVAGQRATWWLVDLE